MDPTQTFLTADELLALPDDGCRHELVYGELRTMAPAGSEHGVITMRLASRVFLYVESRRLGEVFTAETGFRIASDPDTVRAPDLAGEVKILSATDALTGGTVLPGFTCAVAELFP